MTRKFKHKHTGDIAIKSIEYPEAYEIQQKSEYILNRFVENSNDWELVEDKKPILTTEDGVDLYDKDDYWYVYLANYDIHKSIVSIYSETHSTSKAFSTRQAAKDYVNLHKPKFSKQDIITLLTDKFTYGGPVLRFSLEDILELFNCKDE